MRDDRQREYERLIRAVWRNCQDPSDAEDAFEEALLTVWKRWDRILPHPSPQTLILHMCISAAHDALRRGVRRGKRRDAAAMAEDIADPSASAIQTVCGAEQDAQVLRAIGLLSKNQGRAILMHAVESSHA
jgi:DNA-directed RNA polymerase specialized sigma24 family protein